MATADLSSVRKPAVRSDSLSFYYLLFFLSGFPALLYQIVWQRALFTLYGVNIESVTMIVTVFMLGLGLGSLAGGRLSSLPSVRPLVAFGAIEVSIGLFGAASLWIFHRVGALTAGRSTFATGLCAFGLLLIPTLLMGSTLPLLVEHVVRTTGNVGESVGSLYAVNTFGSAVACLGAAVVLMGAFGESGVVDLAFCFNLLVGAAAVAVATRNAALPPNLPSQSWASGETIPLWIGVLLAGVIGFIALAYEIIWYRVFSFATGGKASAFALLLAFYLVGIAIGSLIVQNACKEKLDRNLSKTLWSAACVVLLGSISAFLLGPAVARTVVHIPFGFTFCFVLVSAGLLGSGFPLLAHATIASGSGAGKGISYLYLSNIIGSAFGSFLVGFVILNYWSTRATSTLLLTLGVAAFLTLALLSKAKAGQLTIAATCAAICVALVWASRPIYSGMYERLLNKRDYILGRQFVAFVENRSGEIAVDRDGIVYGGGVYDGRFNTDLVTDTNGIFRAFAIAGMHPAPSEMLIIGLSSGSWAQVVANNPAVKDITIVEINPGYTPLIAKQKEVQSLLSNSKVHIVIDDGRRWLVSHPDRKFDFILMNTTHYWRANASNLLSREFLGLIRAHLKPGGIEYYNTTWSENALATGVAAFPYSLRVSNFLAVSDSPIIFERAAWRQKLVDYSIDGHPVFDLSLPLNRRRLEEVLSVADRSTDPHRGSESRSDMQKRLKNTSIITDDNMGTEWQ
jgi:spermidine synthase